MSSHVLLETDNADAHRHDVRLDSIGGDGEVNAADVTIDGERSAAP